MFHVKHRPVQEAPAALRRPADQFVRGRFHENHWKELRCVTDLLKRFTINAALPIRPATFYSHAVLAVAIVQQLRSYQEVILDWPDQAGRAATAKTASFGENKQAFDNSRFASAVGTVKHIGSRLKFQLNLLQVPEIVNGQGGNTHGNAGLMPGFAFYDCPSGVYSEF